MTGAMPGQGEGGVLVYLLVLFLSCSTTFGGMLHNMAGNDYRVGRRVLHCVVDGVLHERVRLAAAEAGVSVTGWVSGVLEDALGGVVEVGRPDWDAVLRAGREAKKAVYLVDEGVVVDPLEEIA